MEDHDDDDSDAEMADYGTDFSDDVDPNFDASTVVTVVYQGTLESGIGSPVFPVLGGISRFPIPEWPGIGNRETGRFPFGREPGIGVPIRRAGNFLVWVRATVPPDGPARSGARRAAWGRASPALALPY